jgi:Rrf2 family protein
MGFFNSRLRYALSAATDLALQPVGASCQSREIAARQDIPGPYLDQILVALKGAGIVRSIRGAGGGYSLARPADKITAGDVIRALMRGDRLFSCHTEDEKPTPNSPSVAWIINDFEEKIEDVLTRELDRVTLTELASRKHALDDSLSLMSGI